MKYLFCSLASPGLLYPSIRIALTLRECGHHVAFVTDSAFTDLLHSLSLDRIPRAAQDGPSFQIGQWGKQIPVAIQVKHIEYAMERFRPDVLVGQHLTLGPLIVAEREQISVASIGSFTYLWPNYASTEPARTEYEARLRWRYGDMLKHYNQARQLFRLPPCDALPEAAPFLGDAFLLQSVPALIQDPDALPERVHAVGACLWEPPVEDTELTQWLNAARATGEPILYVQHERFFGMPSFWPHLVAACANQPVRVVAALGRMDSEIGAVPANFFVRAHVPQGAVLPYAAAVVANGNTTAVSGALTHGLPSLLIPGGGEQPDVAEECLRLGIAQVLDPQAVTHDNMRQAIRELLDGVALRQQASIVKRAFDEVDAMERSVAILEQLARTGQPVLRSAAQLASIAAG